MRMTTAEQLAIGLRHKAPPPRGSWRWAWRVLFDHKGRAQREANVVHWARSWLLRREARRRLGVWLAASLERLAMQEGAGR